MGPPGFPLLLCFLLPGFSAPLEVTSRHPGRGGVALRASPQQDAPISSCKFGRLQSCQDSDAEAGGLHAPGSVVGGCWQEWLAKGRAEVEGFKKAQVSSWAEAVLIDGGLEADDELIQQTVTTLQQQGVTGKALLRLTLEKLMADGVARGPAELLDEKIRLLQEARLENRLLLTLF